jgi:putative DNA primase/helicase
MSNGETDGSSSTPNPVSLPGPREDPLAADFASEDFSPERELTRHPKHDYVLPTLQNTVAVLTRHPEWRGVIAYDAFSGRIMKRRVPPFALRELGEWSDFDDVRAQLWLSRNYAFEPKKQVLVDAVLAAADHERYHEVRSYLDGLVWDKTSRVDSWLIEYLGAGAFYEAADTPEEKHRKNLTNDYIMAAGRMWLLSAVARIYRPGCRADHVLILEGAQYIGKSSALAALGGEWFTDATLRIGDKEALQLIRGKWIVELPELDSFNRAESSTSKAFFSQFVDRYRASYGRRPTDVPRQCVFAGTVNHEVYLKDDTGNRRYWPVLCRKVALEALHRDRDQIWAEAAARYKAGEAWSPAPGQMSLFEAEQEQRFVGDAWEPVIRKRLKETLAETVSTDEILQDYLHLEKGKWTRQEQSRIGVIFRRMGWVRRRKPDGDREWRYYHPEFRPGVPPPSHPVGTYKKQ